MPSAKHVVTGLVVEVSCEQLTNPDFAALFDVVEGEALCDECVMPEPTVVVSKKKKKEEEEWLV